MPSFESVYFPTFRALYVLTGGWSDLAKKRQEEVDVEIKGEGKKEKNVVFAL